MDDEGFTRRQCREWARLGLGSRHRIDFARAVALDQVPYVPSWRHVPDET